MEAFIESKGAASKLCDGFTVYPQITKNVKVRDKDAVLCDEEIIKKIEEIKNNLKDEGRILLRKSGTEPVIRVMAEAGEEKICNKYVDEVVDLIRKKGYNV